MKHCNDNQKKNQKRIRLALAAALLIGAGSATLPYSGGTAHAADASSEVQVNLAPLNLQIADKKMEIPGGKSNDGDTYIGLAFLGKQLGLTVSWDEQTKIITVSSPNKTMKMSNQDTQYELNGHFFYGSLPPVIIDGTTYLPLRFLLEQMGYNIGYRSEDKLISIQPIQENSLKLTNESIDHSENEYTLTIQYPQIEGGENAAAISKINAFMKTEALKYEASAQELLKQTVADMDAEYPDFHYSFDVNYTVTYNQQNKLSMHFDVYQYTGGAHGMYDWNSHTFDLSTGEEISLKQAARNNADYKQIINDEIMKQIKEREYILLEPFETVRDDQGFYIKDDSIVVYFSLYEYTPYALGIPEFTIPLSRFKSE